MTWEEYKKKNKITQNSNSNVGKQRQIAPISNSNTNKKTTSSWEEYKKKNNITQQVKSEQKNTNIAPINNVVKAGIGSTIKSQLKEESNKLTSEELAKLQAGDKETLKKVKLMSSVAPQIQEVDKTGELRTLSDNSKFKNKNGKLVLEEDGWFKSNNSNITQKILGTVGDAGFNLIKGAANTLENINDLGNYAFAGVADLVGNDEYADRIKKIAQRNLVDEFTQPAQKELDNYSVLGNKSKEVAQGLGYVAGNTAISMVAGGLAPLSAQAKVSTIASMSTTFASSMGGGMTEAYQEGANDGEAFAYGLVSGLGETGSELLFGGLGKTSKAIGLSKGIGGLDDQIAVGLTKPIKNKMAKILIQAGVKSAGEGAEEVISGFVSAVAKKATYMKDEDFGKLVKDQNLWEQFCMGALTSAIAEAPSVGVSIKNGTDYVTLDYEDSKNKSDLAENRNNVEEQQTILNNSETAQNQNMEQIINNNVNDINYYESAKKYNIDTNNELVQSIARVTDERGIKARYDVNIFTDTTQSAIWKISKDENGNTIREVIINPNADTKKSLESIVVHELTHDLEGTIEYNELKELILNYDKGKIGFEESRQALENLYSTVYDKNSVEFNELINNEAVADILGSKLGDQNFINNLNTQNKNLAQRLYSWVVDKLNKINKLTGYKSEKLYWADIKNKFENAFKQEYQANNSNQLYSIAGKTGMNNLIKNNPKEYIGLEQAYNKAQQLQQNGVDNETIRQQTRWFQDKNGDWKFEFSDKDMSLKRNIKLQENKTYKLGDILEHNTLFMAYPELANYDVQITKTNGSIAGSFNPKTKVINIKSENVSNIAKTERTLIHEIQHAIQNIEKFDGGVSSLWGNKVYYESLGEIEAIDTATRFLEEKYKNNKIENIAPESSKSNPQHKNKKEATAVDKVKESIYNYLKQRGLLNENNKTNMEKNQNQNGSLDLGRERRRHLENKQESNIKYSMQESENNSGSFSIQDRKNNAWQNRLDTLYKNKNKGTTVKDLKTPVLDYLDSKKVDYEVDEHNNIIDVENKTAVDDFYKKQRNTKIPNKQDIQTLKPESKVEEFNRYKKNLIKANEKTINDLISYKNGTMRNIDLKIAAKQKLLNSKQNKDTKAVAMIRSQIENLKAQKSKIENLYNEKIDKFNSKVSKEKIELEVRNTLKREARNNLKAEIEPLIQDLTKYKDKKNGLRYNRETAQRNIDDIVIDKELAIAIKETVFDPVQIHQAEKNREINRLAEKINSLDLDKKKKYYYVPKGEIVGIKIDEATLAQLIIEKQLNDTDLRNYGIDDAGIKKIHTTANTFTEVLDYLYDRMNEEQIKYGYSPIGRIENYFPHLFENKPDKMLSKIASYFGIDLAKQELATEIAGKTDTFKPGEVWNSNLKKRRTNKTDYDALTAMQNYINGACEIIYTTEDIQRVREYSKQIRYKFSDEGMKTEIDKIINNTELTQEAKDLSLEGMFRNTKNELSNFVTWLDDYANTLAGKKAFSDRSIEHNIGRNVYSSMSGIESRIAANTIGGNLSVSFTNFAPIFQAAGTTKWNYLITGMLQTAQKDVTGLVTKSNDISFVSNSNFLTNRFGTDTIAKKKTTQKISDVLSIPMNAIDEFTSESIVRAKYLENLDKGMSEEIALDKADKYAAKLMADRSKGALPLIFNAKNPLSKLATMFQVEPNNIVSNYLKDMPRDAKNKKQLTWQATKLMVASYAFNTVMMGIRGRRRSPSRPNKMGILFNTSNYRR